MQVIDLTHTIEEGMPAYPGSEGVRLESLAGIDPDGYNELMLHFPTHTGTHIDCGRHFLAGGPDTSRNPERFIGRGLVIDCQRQGKARIIAKTYLQQFESRLKQADFVIFHTGWSRFWGTSDYFSGFPVPDQEAARYLTGFQLKGIGTDTVSFDHIDSHEFQIHKILLAAGFTLIENLANLKKLPMEGFLFSCLPLKIKDGDGSPVRAVGVLGTTGN